MLAFALQGPLQTMAVLAAPAVPAASATTRHSIRLYTNKDKHLSTQSSEYQSTQLPYFLRVTGEHAPQLVSLATRALHTGLMLQIQPTRRSAGCKTPGTNRTSTTSGCCIKRKTNARKRHCCLFNHVEARRDKNWHAATCESVTRTT